MSSLLRFSRRLGVSAVILILPLWAELPWGDSSRLGRPFSKDPSVIKFQGRYLMYFSLPGQGGMNGWGVGIAESRNLTDWKTIAEIKPEGPYETKGLAAPMAKIVDGQVHLFYQTYGNGPKDAICHAVSKDGIHFDRDPSNPIFHPTGDWNSGRAIDAEVAEFNGKWFLYAASRTPDSKIQIIVGASAPKAKGFSRDAWTQLPGNGPLLKPELPWEQECIEAPTILHRGKTLYMFYAGAYNNKPQQIGLAKSTDGIHWARVSDKPFLPVGPPGSWNSSESGHPGVFVDDDGQTYLFYQGNPDNGKTWLLHFVKLGWRNDVPYILP